MVNAAEEIDQVEGKKPGGRVRCVVVTPERTLLDQLVEFVALPLLDGELGVLPGRSPLIGRLGDGELRTRVGGTTTRTFVAGGFVQVGDDVVTVLTDRATPAEAVDLDAANRELEQAKARRATSEADRADRDRAIDRARAQVRVGSRRP